MYRETYHEPYTVSRLGYSTPVTLNLFFSKISKFGGIYLSGQGKHKHTKTQTQNSNLLFCIIYEQNTIN